MRQDSYKRHSDKAEHTALGPNGNPTCLIRSGRLARLFLLSSEVTTTGDEQIRGQTMTATCIIERDRKLFWFTDQWCGT
ncbi:hypothetical protein RRG08_017107 [Elysia crispata]|uniref:Uncharacterized protein n=1 Tax=Elysia crispata TaxID=231223 RepID=A0AAE0ZNP2_9GAST|nr:hypothetical protein RRG08_017107 [Elysia crispata]